MNKENTSDEISLKILEHIEKNPSITQRDLSSKLGIALGLTNTYIKRLYKKGYIKIRNLTGKKIIYVFTLKGFAEKARLTLNYMARSFNYFKEIKARIEETYSLMIASGIKEIILWGDDELAEFCYITSKGLPIKIVAGISLNGRRNFHELPFYQKDQINSLNFDAILVATFDKKEIAELKNINVKVYYLWQT